LASRFRHNDYIKPTTKGQQNVLLPPIRPWKSAKENQPEGWRVLVLGTGASRLGNYHVCRVSLGIPVTGVNRDNYAIIGIIVD